MYVLNLIFTFIRLDRLLQIIAHNLAVFKQKMYKSTKIYVYVARIKKTQLYNKIKNMSQKLKVTTVFFKFNPPGIVKSECGTLTLKILFMACSKCEGNFVFQVVGVLQKKIVVHRKLPDDVATNSPC